jgi:hypothetical protein
MDKHQQRLPLSYEEKFGYLRAAQFTTLTKAMARNVRNLLEKIHAFSRAGNEFLVEDLADRLSLSKASVFRVIQAAESIAVLRIERRITRGRGQACSRYFIQWDEVRRLAGMPEPPSQDAIPPSQSETPGSQIDMPGSHFETPNKEFPSLVPSSKLPSTTSTARSANGWEAVVEELLRLDVVNARLAVAHAAKRVSPAHVWELIDVYKAAPPGQWGPGALYERIRDAMADVDPNRGWKRTAGEAASAASVVANKARDRHRLRQQWRNESHRAQRDLPEKELEQLTRHILSDHPGLVTGTEDFDIELLKRLKARQRGDAEKQPCAGLTADATCNSRSVAE